MSSIKGELSRQKQSYLKKINLTMLADDSKDKENMSLDYIIAELSRVNGKENQPKHKKAPYEEISPNKLPNHLQLFNNKKEKIRKLWSEFE